MDRHIEALTNRDSASLLKPDVSGQGWSRGGEGVDPTLFQEEGITTHPASPQLLGRKGLPPSGDSGDSLLLARGGGVSVGGG